MNAAMNVNLAVTECLADITPIPIKWLWPGRIAKGKLTLLVGDPGLGKSFITLDMAAHITRGEKWPDGAPCPLGTVLLLSAEDDPADTIRPRLDAMGAEVKLVHILQAVRAPGKNGKLDERSPKLSDIPLLKKS